MLWIKSKNIVFSGYYYVDAIDDNNKMITSAAIMAGFLPFADTEVWDWMNISYLSILSINLDFKTKKSRDLYIGGPN